MGFIKEKYSNGKVGLVAAFKGDQNLENYCNSNSLEEAMDYFNLELKNGFLYEVSAEEKAMQELGININEASQFREQINSLISQMDDEVANQNIVLYPLWKEGVYYQKNSRVRYMNSLYRVLVPHTSRINWTPSKSTSLFEKIEIKNN